MSQRPALGIAALRHHGVSASLRHRVATSGAGSIAASHHGSGTSAAPW